MYNRKWFKMEEYVTVKNDCILESSFHGMVVGVNVNIGEMVEVGTVLFVIQHMKMEIEIKSQLKGCLTRIYVENGDFVRPGDPLAHIGDYNDLKSFLLEDEIEHLTRILLSKKFVYVIGDWIHQSLNREFQKNLKLNRINSSYIDENDSDAFKNDLNQDSYLLVISKYGDNDNVREMIKSARLHHIPVYGIYGDFRCPLAALSDHVMVIDDFSDRKLREVFSKILFNVRGN